MGVLDELSVESALPLLHTHEVRTTTSPWLSRVLDRLRAEFSEAITVRKLAEQAGVHPVHLARVFRKHTECTVGEYVTRLRVDWVARQLASKEDVELAGLAAAAGFSDQSHLTRVFKAVTGCPPGKSRQLLGE
jgi:AraC family transcriptional regulator